MFDLTTLHKDPNNPRISMTDKQFDSLKKSIKRDPEFMTVRPIVYDGNKAIRAGNCRFDACLALGLNEVPDDWVVDCSDWTEAKLKRFQLIDNAPPGISADWDWEKLKSWPKDDLGEWGLWPDDEFESKKESNVEDENSTLAERFGVPPFSILDSRQGYWQDRKKFWRGQIKDFGESREGALSKGSNIIETINGGVSLLDPVLAEILCKWFSVEGHFIVDCFAGDTVFGYVAASLKRRFVGIELREDQTILNNERTKELSAIYKCDDGQNVLEHVKEHSMDMVFSCPPYFDLEVYSAKSNDASNQSNYKDFLKILENAFLASCRALKNDRFACVVVGDIGNKKTGYYYDFCGDIKDMFKRAGLYLYNEMILVNPVGTAAIRAARTFNSGRKVCKIHQNVLVFYKGDTKKIKHVFPEIKIDYEAADME